MTGSEFRAARVRAGLSLRGAAARLGVSLSTIQRWESDANAIPRMAADLIALLAAGSSSARA